MAGVASADILPEVSPAGASAAVMAGEASPVAAASAVVVVTPVALPVAVLMAVTAAATAATMAEASGADMDMGTDVASTEASMAVTALASVGTIRIIIPAITGMTRITIPITATATVTTRDIMVQECESSSEAAGGTSGGSLRTFDRTCAPHPVAGLIADDSNICEEVGTMGDPVVRGSMRISPDPGLLQFRFLRRTRRYINADQLH